MSVNLQTSFLTPPFGFALFYMKGVAPPGVTIQHIYKGIIPFVLLQLIGLDCASSVPGSGPVATLTCCLASDADPMVLRLS